MAFTTCKKIDTHLHLTLERKPGADAAHSSSYIDMLAHLDELNIIKGIVLPGGEYKEFLGTNQEAYAIAQADPEHYAWMCNLDPVEPETVFQRLKTYKEQGAVGIGELVINRRMDDLFLRTVFEAAGRLDLPVTFHMSPEVGYRYGIVDDPGLPLLEQALRDFPDTKFVGHSQCFWIEISAQVPPGITGRQSYGVGPVVPGGRVPELFEKYPNLYGDLSANSAGKAIMRDPEFGLAFLEKYADRLFYATDMANIAMYYPLGSWLDEMVQNGALSRYAYEQICWRNAQREYGLTV